MILQRCTTWTGVRVHLTDDPKWTRVETKDGARAWLIEGRTLCHHGIYAILTSYATDNGPADARPVDCTWCRATAERFAGYIAGALAGAI